MINYDARFKQKTDTLANWEASNPILLEGELAIVILNNGYSKLKFGNGVDNFNALPYYKEELATQESDGLLSANDKVKVDAMSTIFTSDVEPNAPIGSIWIDTSIGGLELGEEVEY